MKASEIENAYKNLMGIRAKKIPVKLSFILSRNLKKMEEVMRDIEEQRNILLEKYGEKGEDGKLVVGENGEVKIPQAAEFIRDMSQVLTADVNITLDGVSMEDIEKCDQDGYDKLTVDEVGALEMFVDGGTE